MHSGTGAADFFRNTVVPEVTRLGKEITDSTAAAIRKAGDGLGNEVVPRTLEAGREGERRVLGAQAKDQAASTGSAGDSSGRGQGEGGSRGGHEAAAQSQGDEVVALIEQRSAELGLHTPAQRALESSLFIDEPLHQLALIKDQPHPELLFGDREWAGYLDARAFARRYGDQELTVPFLVELHRRISIASTDRPGGAFADGRRWGPLTRLLTDREIALVEANPHLEYLPPGTGGFLLDGGINYRVSSPDAARAELESLCDRYNDTRHRSRVDPYRLAAELQQRTVSIHPWWDCNGRLSRLLMNWSLENNGLPPSVLSDFDKDVFSTTTEWTDAVRAGSDTFGERAERLEKLGATADPVAVFGLEGDYELFRSLGRSTAPFDCGDQQDIRGCRRDLEQLRSLRKQL